MHVAHNYKHVYMHTHTRTHTHSRRGERDPLYAAGPHSLTEALKVRLVVLKVELVVLRGAQDMALKVRLLALKVRLVVLRFCSISVRLPR
jgi:hypothetical protein